MNAIIICIADEILTGNTVDTNSTFIAAELRRIGIKTLRILTVPDNAIAIKESLAWAEKVADVVITTGGLGPTNDDKTKIAFAEYFHDELIEDEATLQHLKKLLEKRNRLHLLEINREQASVLSGAIVFQNDYGTAPSMLMTRNGIHFICLPGVPFEVKPLMRDKIIPFLQETENLPVLLTRTVSVSGIPESLLATKIAMWENALPEDISLAYLPSGSRIRLQLRTEGNDAERMQQYLNTQVDQLLPLIKENVISTDGDGIAEIVRMLLTNKSLTVSTAESCTGGGVARLITSVSGSSAYFKGGVVAYSAEQKKKLLGVKAETVEKHTVVSEETAKEMALGCRRLFGTDYAVATTGVAGPNQGDDGKEVGTVYIAVSSPDGERAVKIFMPHLDREDLMNFASAKALEELVRVILLQG